MRVHGASSDDPEPPMRWPPRFATRTKLSCRPPPSEPLFGSEGWRRMAWLGPRGPFPLLEERPQPRPLAPVGGPAALVSACPEVQVSLWRARRCDVLILRGHGVVKTTGVQGVVDVLDGQARWRRRWCLWFGWWLRDCSCSPRCPTRCRIGPAEGRLHQRQPVSVLASYAPRHCPIETQAHE